MATFKAFPVINMGNLSVLTGYIRNKYGTGHRIILSEQGYISLQQKRDVQRAQAAVAARQRPSAWQPRGPRWAADRPP